MSSLAVPVSYRLDDAKWDQGFLFVGWRLALVKNYDGDMVRPQDIGRTQLPVTDATRVWKGSAQVKLSDLVAGDELLVNVSGRTSTDLGHCTDIWVGTETHRQATDAQRKERPEQTPSLPGTDPHSDRPRCGGRESKFLAAAARMISRRLFRCFRHTSRCMT